MKITMHFESQRGENRSVQHSFDMEIGPDDYEAAKEALKIGEALFDKFASRDAINEIARCTVAKLEPLESNK